MKLRFTILVAAALLASSLFGGFFQSKGNRTPKGETSDPAEIIGELKEKIAGLEGQVDDLKRSNRDLTHRATDPDQSQAKEGKNTSIQIQVGLTKDKKDAFTFNGEEVDLKRLEEIIKATAATRPEEKVLVHCGAGTRHQALIQVLGICKRYNMTNFSVIPMDGSKE